jgi:hypothetical protein
MQSLPTGYRALILGASGAIGAAMASQLEADPRCARSCPEPPAVPPSTLEPDSIAVAADSLRQQGPWHLIVVATECSGPTGAPESAWLT